MGDEMIVEHKGFRTKWSVKATGEMPPNPPLEVRPYGEEWEIYQQRSERILGVFVDRDDCISTATTLAIQHKTDLDILDKDGNVESRHSYHG